MNIDSNQLLRFTTAGSVDDGKSTLIGRLLYDSKSIYEDQLDAVTKTSAKKGNAGIDLALFTDGLRDEREQGITIDVAYRYFTTPKRKFIIADTPGHIEYTRNMVTGSSTANVALILIDARNGVVEQTRRHSFIASLLNIPHVLVCVNKMDLVDFEEERFNEIVNDFESMASKLDIADIQFFPISALEGDNVVHRSENMNWYMGGTLLHALETVFIGSDDNKINARFPVQTVLRPQSKEFPDYRGYAGRIAGGIYRVGDRIKVLPSGFSSTIKSINKGDLEVEEAYTPMSVAITLEDDIDISRGDMIVRENNVPEAVQEVDVMLCWMNQAPSQPRSKYIIHHTANEQRAMIKQVIHKIDINTFSRKEDSGNGLEMNDIAKVRLRTSGPLFIDPYAENRITGSIILIDPNTNETVAAGMIV